MAAVVGCGKASTAAIKKDGFRTLVAGLELSFCFRRTVHSARIGVGAAGSRGYRPNPAPVPGSGVDREITKA